MGKSSQSETFNQLIRLIRGLLNTEKVSNKIAFCVWCVCLIFDNGIIHVVIISKYFAVNQSIKSITTMKYLKVKHVWFSIYGGMLTCSKYNSPLFLVTRYRESRVL